MRSVKRITSPMYPQPVRSEPAPSTVEERVAYICNVYRRLGHVDYREIASKYAITEQAARFNIAEARRRIYSEVQDPRQVSQTLSQALDAAIRGALDGEKWRDVAAIARVWADISGVSTPHRIQISQSTEQTTTVLPTSPETRAKILRAMAERYDEMQGEVAAEE